MRILNSSRARSEILKGARILARAVGATLGPGGRVVLIDDRFGRVIPTRDGVTVAKAITLPNNEQNMGARLLAEAATAVANEAGDGTTTCVVIAEALLRHVDQLMGAGIDASVIAAGLRAAAKKVAAELWRNSVPLDSHPLLRTLIASVSCKADQRVIDAVIAAYDHVGDGGVVLLREGDSPRIEVDRQAGFSIAKGWHASAMAPETGMQVEIDLPYVLIANRQILDAAEIAPCLQMAADNGRGLLIVSETLAGSALATAIGNRKAASVMAVTPPGFDDRLQSFMADLAAWTAGSVQDQHTGRLNPLLMGLAAKAVQMRRSTILFGGAAQESEAVTKRIAALEKDRTVANDYDRDKLTERIGRLRGKVAEIAVGAATPAEARELKDRTEDAINAVRVACESGVQPGGGIALIRAAAVLGRTPIEDAMRAAVSAPARRILANAGTDPSEAVLAVSESARWWDGCDAYGVRCSMLSFPDPTTVIDSALRAAVSIVTTLLMAETSISLAD